MKQIIQSLKNGNVSIIDVPVQKKLNPNSIRIKTEYSLISPGTERFLLQFGESNLLKKAIDNPDRTKEVINKIKNEGIIDTYEAVKTKLNNPLALGYSNVGRILEIGNKVEGFKVGQRVLSNSPHAEEVIATQNTCAVVPVDLKSEHAVFGVLGSVALQGIRLLKPNFGETIIVSGLGIIGLLSCQILKSNGCKVIGIDPDKDKCLKASEYGIKAITLEDYENTKLMINNLCDGYGADGVLITANTTSNDPIDLAAEVCRKRGKIVLVGVAGLALKRDLFYEKELSFQVSCSYGPGRYDSNYEIDCNDYPIGYVRWTEKRNFQSVLYALSENQIDPKSLITHCFNFLEAKSAYELLKTNKSVIGILLKYSSYSSYDPKKYSVNINLKNTNSKEVFQKIGFIGAGNYAASKLLPAFSKSGANMFALSSISALKPYHLGRKYKFKKITTNINDIFDDEEITTVVISTRHDSHADLIKKALINNKNIFIEKPICVNENELKMLKDLYLNLEPKKILMVGFNRRFSQFIVNIKNKLEKIKTPKSFIYNINAGFLPAEHWIKKTDQGGRLIGEACHFIDLIRFLSGSKIKSNFINKITDDTFIINLTFENGDISSIHYTSEGTKSFPKERLEVFGANEIITLNNFRSIRYWNNSKMNKKRFFSQDKGHLKCISSFLDSIENSKQSPIPIEEIFEVQEVLLELANS